MARFNTAASTRNPFQGLGPVERENTPSGRTGEGAPAFARSAKGDLFLFAAANMVGQDTFYEAASSRDERFRSLVHQVAVEDFDWLTRFALYLRNDLFMRSASVVLAAEGAHAWLKRDKSIPIDNPKRTVRILVDNAIGRLDEVGEFIGYWHMRYGRTLPVGVKRGLGDAVTRLTNEYSAMKYDGTAKAIRLGDVIDLVHPVSSGPAQSALFNYLISRRHHAADEIDPARVSFDLLPQVSYRRALESLPAGQRRLYMFSTHRNGSPQVILRNAGATWEWLSGWLPGGMDAQAWEAVIPSMGHMALIRNLRNFDRAGISPTWVEYVQNRISDPDEVSRGMQFPFRYYSAFLNSDGGTWGPALTRALDASTSNIPDLTGRTLVLSDTSGSMFSGTISEKSTITPAIAAAVFAAAVARKNPGRVDLVQWATTAQAIPFRQGTSVLTMVATMEALSNSVGWGTNLDVAMRHYNPREHDRIIVFSDMQLSQRWQGNWPTRNVYLWNLQGYSASVSDGSIAELGGMSDAAFRMIQAIEVGLGTTWPF